MSEYAFLLLLAVAAAFSAVHPSTKVSLIALWLCGLFSGGLFLSLGYEVMALLQWLVSTLITILYFFYFSLMGDIANPPSASKRPFYVEGRSWIGSGLVGLGITMVVYLGSKVSLESGLLATSHIETEGGIFTLGENLVKGHFLSAQLIGLAILILVIGTGVIVRPENVQTEQDRGDT